MNIFVGGGTLEGIEAVCSFAGAVPGACPEDIASDVEALPIGTRLLALVTALVQQSLLHREVGPEGEVRFTMLATIREYAQERLAVAEECEVVARHHADYYRGLAAQGEEGVRGRAVIAWLDLEGVIQEILGQL